MRDANRLKDRYEFSLDTRHVVSLTVVGLVALAGVFSLGVLVGKRGAPSPAAGEPVDVLAALDEKANAPDASLTFQEELTRNAPKALPPVVAKVEPKAEPKPDAKVEVKPDLKATIAKAATEPATETSNPSTPGTAALPELAPVAAVVPAPVVAPTPAPRVADPPAKDLVAKDREIVPARTISNDAGGLAAALQRAQRTPEAPAATGGFALQLSAYQDRAEAEKHAAAVKAKGYAPYLVEANVPGKGVWFRVRLGHFSTREAATKYQSDFKRETQLQSIVTGE